ncbi:MAG: hypothetical protein COU07_03170 [Candidatus Harrisonbacteria bacterium CG10_big_fil_rev_8_21_14_0_10_40_38]|uniref:Peptidase M28 domain-containing protein n=1 Tax=Candidatus Harrisonbacteria bacterium CG10_big_fil_rev_8_21_14_0_10_40_38 TaxID=1974583 RepID=A0A2H0UTF9_9BACT|nr:MAG: hypothetical protein COU07_03170 [Candidatus Harrisonbacteria bacterium CG10_big_fil_rev_8_21_14_0_10_40_38]
MKKLIEDLWFGRRDLVSFGYDKALDYVGKIIPLTVHTVPSGEKAWTWTIPDQWEVKSAYIEDMEGNRLLDLKDHPLHVVAYSDTIDKIVNREELLAHLHTKTTRPNAIPYEFKFYKRDWGFCIQHNKLNLFNKEKYRVFIDASFKKGELKIGECVIPGAKKESIALIAHLDHPAMVNDDLSGVAVAVEIAKELFKKKLEYTYRIIILPETIGSVAYLSSNENIIPSIKYGIFLEMLGNSNSLALQRSRQDTEKIDRVAQYVLKKRFGDFLNGSFRTVVRNDEMVWNGPGVDIPTISVSRSAGEPNHYPEYHTSDDTPEIVSVEKLEEARDVILEMISIIDNDYFPKRKFRGPVFLSGYDLWIDWRVNPEMNKKSEQIMLRLEGNKSVFDIADELDLSFLDVKNYLDKFLEKKLIEKIV